VFLLFDIRAFFLHFFFLYYAVHVIVYRQVFELRGVFSFIENKLELVLLSIG
jgi:hypothetical protein